MSSGTRRELNSESAHATGSAGDQHSATQQRPEPPHRLQGRGASRRDRGRGGHVDSIGNDGKVAGGHCAEFGESTGPGERADPCSHRGARTVGRRAYDRPGGVFAEDLPGTQLPLDEGEFTEVQRRRLDRDHCLRGTRNGFRHVIESDAVSRSSSHSYRTPTTTDAS